MKTLQNVFGKKSLVKSINSFEIYSLNATQMNCIKGGTIPVTTAPPTQIPDNGAPSNNI